MEKGHTRSQSRLTCQNLISFDPSAITSNFRIIGEQLEMLERLNSRMEIFAEWRCSIDDRLNELKDTCERNNTEVRSLLRNQSKRRQSFLPEPLNLIRQSGVDLLHNIAQLTHPIVEPLKPTQQPAEEWAPRSELELLRQSAIQQSEHYNGKLQKLQQELREARSDFASYERLREVQESIGALSTQQAKTVDELQQLQRVVEGLRNKASAEPTDFSKPISELKMETSRKLEAIGTTLKKKIDAIDLVKLEDLLVNLVEQTTVQLSSKIPSITQTKKALIFLEKRLNRLYLGGCGTFEGDPLVAGRSWCLSCSKEDPKIKQKPKNLPPESLKSTVGTKSPTSSCSQTLPGGVASGYVPQSAKYTNQTPAKDKMEGYGISSHSETNIMSYYGQQSPHPLRVHFEYMSRTLGGIKGYLDQGQQKSN